VRRKVQKSQEIIGGLNPKTKKTKKKRGKRGRGWSAKNPKTKSDGGVSKNRRYLKKDQGRKGPHE